MELLLGAGSSTKRHILPPDRPDTWTQLITLDIEPNHSPDVLWDLDCGLPLPFPENFFDEIHAYEVLEHLGKQGDAKGFFRDFSDYWRVLKPNGFLVGSVPQWTSCWAWGDPSHKRVLPREVFAFLDQSLYGQVGTTAMTDFRSIYKADFHRCGFKESGHHLLFVLQAVKPSRWAILEPPEEGGAQAKAAGEVLQGETLEDA